MVSTVFDILLEWKTDSSKKVCRINLPMEIANLQTLLQFASAQFHLEASIVKYCCFMVLPRFNARIRQITSNFTLMQVLHESHTAQQKPLCLQLRVEPLQYFLGVVGFYSDCEVDYSKIEYRTASSLSKLCKQIVQRSCDLQSTCSALSFELGHEHKNDEDMAESDLAKLNISLEFCVQRIYRLQAAVADRIKHLLDKPQGEHWKQSSNPIMITTCSGNLNDTQHEVNTTSPLEENKQVVVSIGCVTGSEASQDNAQGEEQKEQKQEPNHPQSQCTVAITTAATTAGDTNSGISSDNNPGNPDSNTNAQISWDLAIRKIHKEIIERQFITCENFSEHYELEMEKIFVRFTGGADRPMSRAQYSLFVSEAARWNYEQIRERTEIETLNALFSEYAANGIQLSLSDFRKWYARSFQVEPQRVFADFVALKVIE